MGEGKSEINLCNCGCKIQCKQLYVHGHNRRGKQNSEKQRQAIVNANKKRNGEKRQFSEQHCKNISKSKIGISLSNECIEAARKVNLGKKLSLSHRTKISTSISLFLLQLTEEEKRHRITPAQKAAAIVNKSKFEEKVSNILSELGLFFIQHFRIGKYAFDFFIPEFGVLIECNGCYWHDCEHCGLKRKGAHARHLSDENKSLMAEELGYKVIIIWEHNEKINQHLVKVLNLKE